MMWWTFVILLVTIPLFVYVDNKHLADQDLLTVHNLVLSKDSEYDPGGGKSGPPSIKFYFYSSKRGFYLTYEEYQCVSKNEILTNFKKGDLVSIKIWKDDKYKFKSANWFSKYSNIYGLAKNNKDYLSLDCINKISDKRTFAATTASIVSAILALFFALTVLKPKTKYQALGQLPIDPFFIVLLTWVMICISLR